MGNTLSSYYPQRFPLDDSSVVVFRKTKFRRGRESEDTWSAFYNSFGWTNCELKLTKTNGDYNHEQKLTISIHDYASDHAKDYVDFQMDVSMKDDLLLGNITVNGPASMLRLPQCKILIPQGGVLKSSSYLYGSDTERKGLLVMSRARTHDDDKVLPYMITVTHYFVAACCSHGVFLVAKILSNSADGGMRVEIEKSTKLPKLELLKIFDDVKQRGYWPDTNSADWAVELSNQNKNPANASSNMAAPLIDNAGYVKGGHFNGSFNMFFINYMGKKET